MVVTDYDIVSGPGVVVLRFADGEGKESEGPLAQPRDVSMSTSFSLVPHPSLPPLPLSQSSRFNQRGSYPLFFFRQTAQWRHGAVSAERHTLPVV